MRVLLVEEHEIARQGIRALLDNAEGISIIGDVSNGGEAMQNLSFFNPDLVLIDIHLPEISGLECIRYIKKNHPSIKVLILSMNDQESYVIEMLDAGADGYILKSSSKEELIFAIRKIANNSVYISSEFTLRMVEKYKALAAFTHHPNQPGVHLSRREMDVLQLIAEGYTNIEIAEKIFTSRRTVETHRKNLLEKTNTKNTATLIRFALLNGLIK